MPLFIVAGSNRLKTGLPLLSVELPVTRGAPPNCKNISKGGSAVQTVIAPFVPAFGGAVMFTVM